MEIIRFADSKSRPWLNGEGSTRFLLDDDTGNGWTYRVSVADLTGSQAFSRLHGVHRHLLFLGPGRLRLNVNGDSKVVSLFECVQFEGEDAVVSEPSKSPARDLNVMIRRDAGTARILQTTRLNIVLPAIAWETCSVLDRRGIRLRCRRSAFATAGRGHPALRADDTGRWTSRPSSNRLKRLGVPAI